MTYKPGTKEELERWKSMCRRPRFAFGARLRDHYGFVGIVVAAYADYGAAVGAMIVGANWFDIQEKKPSSMDQIFYDLVSPTGRGAVLAGENDVTEEPPL